MAEWAGVIVQVVMLLGLGIVGFVKLNNYQSRESGRTDALEKRMETHSVDDVPHRACASHNAELKSITDSLFRIESSLGLLDRRVYSLVRNSSRGHESSEGNMNREIS